MSKQKKAQLARRELREKMAKALPMKVVPSKKGLVTTFIGCASFGFIIGLIIEHFVKR